MLPDRRTWTRTLAIATSVALAGGFAGLLLAWSGLYDISASRGHWDVTRALLAFAMRSSVQYHAEDIETPPLDDPTQLHLGLSHYEGGCEPCHGAPGEPPNPVTQQAVPKPPYLPDHVTDWKPRELFWIIKHGVKYTSMPAWPAQTRDDEVWAIVAAVVRFPDMTAVEYRRLLRTDTRRDPRRIEEDARLLAAVGPVGETLVACARCHGLDGAGGGAGAFPRLAGLDEAHIVEALRDYAVGVRPSGVMQAIAVELTDEQMRVLARHYASMTDGGAAAAVPDPLGATIALEGVPAARIPPCAPCHGPGAGADRTLAPRLAGQHAFYLAHQLRLWRRGVRGNEPAARVMSTVAAGLTDERIDAVAAYYSALGTDAEARAAATP